jgi:hypothetical protein
VTTYLANLRSEEADRGTATDRAYQRERPNTNSPSNRCTDYRDTYTCGHRDTMQARDSRCRVCSSKIRAATAGPPPSTPHHAGKCPRGREREEWEKRAREAEMEAERWESR